MNLHTINTGFFKLDGGAMFGVVPKSMWQKLNPPDDKNLCSWQMRCLLIETQDRKILIDTGLGNKQSDKFRSHFEPHGKANLIDSLSSKGLTVDDITDVFLTHFHFDHVGGAVKKSEDKLVPTFPNAKYWTNKVHLDWALEPNAREEASFLKENFVPLIEADVLQFIPIEDQIEWMEGIKVRFVYGHTEAMMIPEITLPNGNRIIYCADLMPSSFHIRLPYVMSYDIRPLVSLEERKALYSYANDPNCYLFFEHDPNMAIGQLKQDSKGRNQIERVGSIDDLF